MARMLNLHVDLDAVKLAEAIEAFGQQAIDHFVQGVQQLAEATMTLSKSAYVPVVTGTLRSSGFVTELLPVPGGYVVDAGYGGAAAAYAATVHFRPKSVGQGKNLYLTKPLQLMARHADQAMAAWMTRLWSGGSTPHHQPLFPTAPPSSSTKAKAKGLPKPEDHPTVSAAAAAALTRFLDDEGLGEFASDLFRDFMPAQPDELVAVMGMGGVPSYMLAGPSAVVTGQVQVQVRSATTDYLVAEQRSMDIMNAIEELMADYEVTSPADELVAEILSVTVTQTPVLLERDESERVIFITVYDVVYLPAT